MVEGGESEKQTETEGDELLPCGSRAAACVDGNHLSVMSNKQS